MAPFGYQRILLRDGFRWNLFMAQNGRDMAPALQLNGDIKSLVKKVQFCRGLQLRTNPFSVRTVCWRWEYARSPFPSSFILITHHKLLQRSRYTRSVRRVDGLSLV